MEKTSRRTSVSGLVPLNLTLAILWLRSRDESVSVNLTSEQNLDHPPELQTVREAESSRLRISMRELVFTEW